MTKVYFWTLIGVVVLLQGVLIATLWWMRPLSESGFNPGLDKRMDFANALLAREMPSQAVDEFTKILTSYHLSGEKAANVHYTIGTTMMDRLHDWDGALYHFMLVKQFFPGQSYEGELNRRVVACLEALNRPIDAQNMMESITSLNDKKSAPEDHSEVIALIGTRQVKRGEVDGWIRSLPGPYQSQFQGPMGFYQAVQSYIGQELLYDTAKRKGFDQDKEMNDQLAVVKRSIMMHRLYQEEIGKDLVVTDMDLQNFYKAHKERYQADQNGKKVDAPFPQVRAQVENDYRSQKEVEGQQMLFQRAMQAERVQIFSDKIGVSMQRDAGGGPPPQGPPGKGKAPAGAGGKRGK